MSRYTFLDTLTEIEARATSRAINANPEPRAKTASSGMRALAEGLRKVAEAPDPVIYDDLYAVRDGSWEPPAPIPARELGDGPGAPLRKLADDLRQLDRSNALVKHAQARDILTATSGLTLLRDSLRSSR